MQSDYKGIFNLTDDLKTNFKWNIYKYPIDENILKWSTFNYTAANSISTLKAVIQLN